MKDDKITAVTSVSTWSQCSLISSCVASFRSNTCLFCGVRHLGIPFLWWRFSHLFFLFCWWCWFLIEDRLPVGPTDTGWWCWMWVICSHSSTSKAVPSNHLDGWWWLLHFAPASCTQPYCSVPAAARGCSYVMTDKVLCCHVHGRYQQLCLQSLYQQFYNILYFVKYTAIYVCLNIHKSISVLRGNR